MNEVQNYPNLRKGAQGNRYSPYEGGCPTSVGRPSTHKRQGGSVYRRGRGKTPAGPLGEKIGLVIVSVLFGILIGMGILSWLDFLI
jgi:hypothetical protein